MSETKCARNFHEIPQKKMFCVGFGVFLLCTKTEISFPSKGKIVAKDFSRGYF